MREGVGKRKPTRGSGWAKSIGGNREGGGISSRERLNSIMEVI
jgi:hypothetical protein